MAMGTGGPYLSSTSPPLQQWSGGVGRFAGPRFYLSSSSSSPPATPSSSVPSQPVLTLPRRIAEVAGKPSFPSEASRSLATQNSSSSMDEGFFRRRRGEGKSSGGGPSANIIFPRSEVPSVASSTADLLQSTAQRSEPPAPATFRASSPTLPPPLSVANGFGGKAGFKVDEEQVSRQSFDRRSPRNRQQAAEPSFEPAGLDKRSPRNRGQSVEFTRRQQSGGRTPQTLADGFSEGSVERSRTGEAPRTGRGGEGKSSGGGPSSISLGTPDEKSRSRSVDTLTPHSRRENGRFSPAVPEKPSPSKSRMSDEVAGKITRSPFTVEPPRSSVAETQSPADFSSDLSAECRPSYDELLAENAYLRKQLVEAQSELASYRRWYG